MFGRKVAQMQGAEKFVTGATWKVVRIANFSATPQMGDFSFKHYLCTLFFNYSYSHIRTHGAANGAVNAILRSGLKDRKMPFCIYLVGDFKHVFRAEMHTKATPFAPFGINNVFIFHYT